MKRLFVLYAILFTVLAVCGLVRTASAQTTPKLHVKIVDSVLASINYERAFDSILRDAKAVGSMDPFINDFLNNTDTTDTGTVSQNVVFFEIDTTMKIGDIIQEMNVLGYRPLRFEELGQLNTDAVEKHHHRGNINGVEMYDIMPPIVALGSSRPCALIGGDWYPYLDLHPIHRGFDIHWFGKVRWTDSYFAAVKLKPQKL